MDMHTILRDSLFPYGYQKFLICLIQKNLSRLALLFGSLLLLCVTTPAKAACSNNFPLANTNVVCTGIDTIGVQASANNVNVTVNTGASLLTTYSGTTNGAITIQGSSNVSNSGAIDDSNDGRGISILGPGSTVTNTITGSIAGITGIGLSPNTDGTVIINSGQITGSTNGIASFTTSPGSTGIVVTNNTTGTISGTNAILLAEQAGPLQVNNYGTVTGNTYLSGPTNTVLMGPSAVFSGIVVPLAGSNNTLELAGIGSGNFNLNNIGPGQQFQNFTNIVENSAGKMSTWTVTGSNTLPWTVDNGVLNIASGANAGGNMAINGGTVNLLGGTSTIGGNVTLASAATLTGIGTVMGNVSNGGTIDAGLQVPNPTAANVGALTIQGNYIGMSGSLNLRAQLNGDNSPRDQLIINGAGPVSGVTSIFVTNLPGSLGAVTTNGIPLVITKNSGPAGAFKLGHPAEAGVYEYYLQQVGNNWDLFSQLNTPNQPSLPIIPFYRASVSAYTLGHINDLEYGFASVADLHQRVGDLSNPRDRGSWGRIVTQRLSLGGSLFDEKNKTFGFLQLGQDLPWHRLDFPNGQTHTGAMLTLGGAQGDFYDPKRALFGFSTRTNQMNTESAAIGLYWTHYSNRQAYLDAVAQANYYTNHYKDVCPTCTNQSTQRGFGEIISLEAGYPFFLFAQYTSWALEPQAQLAYQHLGLSAFSDQVSSISSISDNLCRGRFGLRLAQPALQHMSSYLPNASPYLLHVSPYLLANVYQDFVSPSSVTIAGINFNNTLAKTWFEVGAGLTAPLLYHTLSGFFDARYQTAFGRREAYQALIGLRLSV